MATLAKPENALKRAEELINVGQKQDALQTLHDLIITSKRYRAWEKTLEQIMFKFMDLCVDLKSARFAKDGLIQYRILCQQVNVSSLEEVIKHFLHLATEKAEQADALEEALHAVDEDLEADVKFLWETYRTVLEILRHNSNLEALYAATAHKALHFCKKYKRPTEFRRLCEMIRNHNRYRDQRDGPELSSPESFQLCLDTRFDQFKVATELGLWQEAFRSVEDMYGLMCMVKETPKSSLLMLYYSKLIEVFWISSSHLYHAYAWFKLFTLQNKNLSQKDLQLIASSLILAALSIPPFGRVQENEKEGDLRMANLIGFDLEPKLDILSRSGLVSELVSRGVLSCASQEVQDLFNVFENEFHPLDLGSKIQPLLEKISKSGGKLSSAPCLPQVVLSQYVPSLEKLATLRLFQHVSKIYQTIRIESLSQLVPFFEFSVVEKIAVDAFVAMKVDHMKGVVTFGNLGVESDGVKDHLDVFAESLSKVRAMVYPPVPSKTSKLGGIVADIVEKEHKSLVARKSIIEKRKEDQERQKLEMEREEEQRRLQLQKLTVEAEQKRLAAELEERRRRRILKEIEERELGEAKALLEETEKRMRKGKKKTLLDGEEKVTKQNVMERIFTAKVKERQEMEKKLENLAKTMDYLERAKREEAASLIEAAYRRRLVEEREFYEGEQEREVEVSKERHESDLKEKKRLFRMLDDKNIFQASSLILRQH